MDEPEYERLAADALRRVLDLYADVDSDDADVEPGGDVVRITHRDGSQIVVNTQRPARQIWLAGGRSAWHFSYDAESARWLDDKGRGDELFATLRRLTHDATGIALPGLGS